LAKELGIAISPLRRELIRLEELGVLKAFQEANIRFYIVDQTCPSFLQLKQALGGPTDAPVEQMRRGARPRLALSSMVSALSLSIVLVVGVALVAYQAIVNRQLLSLTREAVAKPQTPASVAQPASDVSSLPVLQGGEMRSARWRLLPGTIGGFGSGAGAESY
jgi:hypothetical protein